MIVSDGPSTSTAPTSTGFCKSNIPTDSTPKNADISSCAIVVDADCEPLADRSLCGPMPDGDRGKVRRLGLVVQKVNRLIVADADSVGAAPGGIVDNCQGIEACRHAQIDRGPVKGNDMIKAARHRSQIRGQKIIAGGTQNVQYRGCSIGRARIEIQSNCGDGDAVGRVDG